MSDPLFERAVRNWLEDGSDRTPPSAIDAVLLAVKTTPQERDLRILRRFIPMTFPVRLAAGVALVAVVGFAGLSYFGHTGVGNGGPPPTCTSASAPVVSPQPGSTPLDRATWKTYVATPFGFSICYPADWVVRTADMPPDPSHPAYGTVPPTEVHFVDGQETIFLSAWSNAVAPGTTLDALVQATCAGYQITCPNWQAEATPVSVDGHPGSVALLGSWTGWTEAFLLVDNRVYRVTSGRAPGEYNSDTLVRTFFSTMHLLPGGPVTTPGG